MSVGEDPVPAQKTVYFQLEDGLQWAGAAALLGSKKPLVWGILGTMIMGVYRSR
jgi:hypothetical protein